MKAPFLYTTRTALPSPSLQLRTRRELSTKDTVNARFFEQWQTDGPALTQDRADLSGAKVLMDMNPIPSRNSIQDYRQSQSFVATGPQLGANPYFDRYDPVADPRNAIRELRNAVYEDKSGERGVIETRRLLERGFTSRWLPEGFVEANNMDSLTSFEILRPKTDDITKNYRK